jgi:hypothetical protein
MCDSFVHTIKGLQGGDLVPQTPVEFNGPLHSNWVGLPKLIIEPIINKQLV